MSGVATFPLLRTPELVSSLVDIGLQHITADEIDRPTAVKVVPIYAWFLSALTQLTLEDVCVAAQLQLDNMEDQEIYRETIYVGALWAVLNQVMHWACLDDFSVRDIRDPQAPRVRRVLSALLNFYLFEQDQMPRLMALEDAAEEVAKTEHDMERKHVSLQSGIEKRQTELDSQAEQASEIEKSNSAMRNVLLEKRSIAANAAQKIEVDKRDRSALQTRLENMQTAISAHEVEIARLRSRIVQSPNRVKQSLLDLGKAVAQMKDDILEIEAKGRDHQSRISALKRYEVEISTLIKTVEEWEAELDKAAEGQEKLIKLSDERDARSEDLKELELYAQQLNRRIQAAIEQRERHVRQAEGKKETLQKRMSEMQDTHEALMAQRQDVDEEAAKRHRAIAMKEREINDLVKAAETDIAQGEAAYRELKIEVLGYSTKLNKALDGLNAYLV